MGVLGLQKGLFHVPRACLQLGRLDGGTQEVQSPGSSLSHLPNWGRRCPNLAVWLSLPSWGYSPSEPCPPRSPQPYSSPYCGAAPVHSADPSLPTLQPIL